jgi:hypothetical protein
MLSPKPKLSSEYKKTIYSLLLTCVIFIAILMTIPTFREFLCVIFSETPNLETGKVYKDTVENINFNIKYPQNWERQNLGTDQLTGDVAVFFPSQYSDLQSCTPLLSINFESLQKTQTLDEYTQLAIEEINKNTTETNIIETQEITLANYKGKKLVYTGKDGQCNLKVMQVLRLKKNKVFYLTYRANEDNYCVFVKTAENMISSLEIND